MTDLKNKVALITGGGRGIGRAIALALARAGCHVAVTGRNPIPLAKVADEARSHGIKAAAIALDLENGTNCARILEQTTAQIGEIDFLINNAAVLHPAPFLEATLADWDRTMNVNLRSAFLLCQHVLRSMSERRSGYIINISSTVAHGVKPEVAAYGASKCGLAGLTEALYAAGKPFGVRASVIYPGVTDTPMVRDLAGDNSVGNPSQWMQPDDIAHCVLFLLTQSPRMVVKEITPWAVGYDKI